MPTIPQTQNILKSYFETGDVPTQAQFGELIETMFYYDGQALNNAAAAVAAANAVAPFGAKALLRATAAALGASWTKDKSLNVATVTALASDRVRVTFSNAFSDANYITNANSSGTLVGGAPFAIISITQTTTYVEFAFSGAPLAGAKLNVSVFNLT